MISIITPTYNSEKTIEKNVDSIISQGYKDFEHIIIDNLSSDKTLEIIKSLYEKHGIPEKLKIINEKDNGISDAFNKGIKAANGEIIAILNSDDYYFDENVLGKVYKAFDEHEILFTHGNMKFIDDVYGSNIRKPLLCDIREAMPYNHPTMFFRKSVYNEFGMFDESYKYAMDFELVCRFEKMIENFRIKGKYLKGDPVAVQLAGGESWRNELGGIEDVRKALIKHNFWNSEAERFYKQRVFRTKLKKYLHTFGLDVIVKLWRNKKWA